MNETNLIEDIKLLLGDKIIDIELESDHYEISVKLAFDKFRQQTEKLQTIYEGDDQIVVDGLNHKTDDQLLEDSFARPWIRDYAVATAEALLAKVYAKHSAVTGLTNKAETLRSEAADAIDRLEDELFEYIGDQVVYYRSEPVRKGFWAKLKEEIYDEFFG